MYIWVIRIKEKEFKIETNTSIFNRMSFVLLNTSFSMEKERKRKEKIYGNHGKHRQPELSVEDAWKRLESSICDRDAFEYTFGLRFVYMPIWSVKIVNVNVLYHYINCPSAEYGHQITNFTSFYPLFSWSKNIFWFHACVVGGDCLDEFFTFLCRHKTSDVFGN